VPPIVRVSQARISLIARTDRFFIRFIKTAIMSDELVDKLTGYGVKFAAIEDASSAVMHLASDTSLNGRALAVVTRDVDPRGYMDLREDDYREGEFLLKASQEVRQTSHRIGTQ